MGKKSRTKGKRAELELMHELNDVYGFQTRRGDCFRHEPDLMGVMSIHVEVKRAEDIKLSGWLKQAAAAAEKYKDGLPAVFHRKSREPWFVSMLDDDFDQMDPVDVLLKPCTGTCNPAADIDDNCDGVVYFRKIGCVVTLPLKEWVGIYWNWKLPFTEDNGELLNCNEAKEYPVVIRVFGGEDEAEE